MNLNRLIEILSTAKVDFTVLPDAGAAWENLQQDVALIVLADGTQIQFKSGA